MNEMKENLENLEAQNLEAQDEILNQQAEEMVEGKEDNELPPQDVEEEIKTIEEELKTIDIETLKEMLGEVSRTPEIEKGVETEGEEEPAEEVDFSLLGEALYSIYAQGLRWATYVILSRIIPGYEEEVLSGVALPRSAQRQLVKAFNRFLQKKFNDWSIRLSEEGLVLSLMLLYSITYIGQAMMMAYQIRRMYAYQMQFQIQETQEEEPKPKRSSRRRSNSRSRSSGRRGSRRKKTEETVNGETTE